MVRLCALGKLPILDTLIGGGGYSSSDMSSYQSRQSPCL